MPARFTAFAPAALPANAKSCTLSFTYYAQIAAADDGNCANDTLKVMASVNGAAPVALAGDPCSAKTASSNPMGWSQQPASKKMSYDMTALVGKNVGISLVWANNATQNNGLGAIVDNVLLTAGRPKGGLAIGSNRLSLRVSLDGGGIRGLFTAPPPRCRPRLP
ncbi:MAG: hypothetical protein FJ100_13470 [Deltaproteobacteria bacterium]|nr:hypothetical protein [Deltaproteobacteria bacterium]